MWIQHKNGTDSVVSSQPPATYFINSTPEEKVAEIRGVRNPRYKAYYAENWALATYRKQFKKGGNGTNRTHENLESIGSLVVDIDWDRTESLDHQRLLDHCDKNGVPRPNKIISTPTPNHYQLFWNYPYIPKNKLGWHYRTAKALYKFFEEFDADPSTTVDPTKITRNPDYLEANTAYRSDDINTLGFIYHALKKTGLIKNKSKNKYPRRKSQIPFSYSLNAIESFLGQQGTYKGTHESIYKELDIPKSTYFLLLKTLKKQEKISITTLRVGKTWVTEFKYFDSLRKEFIDRLFVCSRGVNGNSFKKNVGKMVQKFNNGAVNNFRNNTTFVLSRNLAYLGYTQGQILQKLSQGLDICKQYGYGFDDKEIERTIKSACNPKYQNPFSYSNEIYQRAVRELNLNN